MSYCVNCGVKLDDALNKCPLCNTPVINPKELKKKEAVSPFPTKHGETEKVRTKDIIILTSVFLATTIIWYFIKRSGPSRLSDYVHLYGLSPFLRLK